METSEKNTGAGIRTRAGWAWSMNATCGLCRSLKTSDVIRRILKYEERQKGVLVLPMLGKVGHSHATDF